MEICDRVLATIKECSNVKNANFMPQQSLLICDLLTEHKMPNKTIFASKLGAFSG
ncbi:MAG: hypothetical protein ACI9XB_000200 [Gammaproteobacteria bacterium]|jgi:hypothetical protein